MNTTTKQATRTGRMTGIRRSSFATFANFWTLVCLLASCSTLLAEEPSASGTRPDSVKPLFRDFMGINGHTLSFKPALFEPVCQLVRDYHPIDWDFGKETDYPLEFPKARNGVDWNAVYGPWKERGFTINACLKFGDIPVEQWQDLAKDAENYGQQFASSFGPESQSGLVQSIQIGNEPGKYDDVQYREIFKSMATGIRRADPKMTIATCNIYVGDSGDYHKSVDCLVGLEDLYDALAIHAYAMLNSWPKWERSYPEDPRFPGFIRDIDRLINWRNENASDKEVWLTEFGYDSSTKTPTQDDEFAQWKGCTDTEQAQWLVRSFFLFATRDLQRAYIFFHNDQDEPKLHASSGLTRNYAPKPSFYAVSHLQATLGDYRFSRVVSQLADDLCLYEFEHGQDTAKKIWVAWSPTGNQRSVTVEIPIGDRQIESIECMPLSAEPPSQIDVEQDRDQLILSISESPTYIRLSEPR